MNTSTLTYGFGRPFVMPPTTGQLLKIEKEFEIPKNQKELLALTAAKEELLTRAFDQSGLPDYEQLEQTLAEKDQELFDLRNQDGQSDFDAKLDAILD